VIMSRIIQCAAATGANVIPQRRQPLPQVSNYKNKAIIVTGAGRGIARAAALLMAQEGARLVVVADSRDDRVCR